MTAKTNTYSVLFFVRSSKLNRDGKVPIYMRITINGVRTEISTKQWIEPGKWNEKGSVAGKSNEARMINTTLESLRARAWKTYRDLEEKYPYVSVDMVKSQLSGNKLERKTLLEAFTEHNSNVLKLVGKEYAHGTYKRFETVKNHLIVFIKLNFKKEDIYLVELTHSFIEDYYNYLRTVAACNHNTALKYIKLFRKVINLAVKNDWLLKDPFAKFTSKFQEVKRDFLTKEEMSRIEDKEFQSDRLNKVKDIFLFGCYTGLSYIDIFELTHNELVKDEDGDFWIKTNRTKTGTDSSIPLLSIPLAIVRKYENDPEREISGKLLPVRSNQKLNDYMKEIAAICGISKKLTMHIARHTFATTVTLTNDVPIESVSKMLGHKNIRTTQIYAKIVDKKVSSDMKKLKEKLNENI